jgi:hypothetical protein
MDVERNAFHFYTDSKIVPGYISNDNRRFHFYVANRVGRIRSFSRPHQWCYIATDCNPADLATREFPAHNLPDSIWINGPPFLYESGDVIENPVDGFPLVNAVAEKEVRSEVNCAKTALGLQLGVERFSRFSSWQHLGRAVMNLKKLARRHKDTSTDVFALEAEDFILKKVQRNVISEWIAAIMEGCSPLSNSSLLPLKPILGNDGLLRFGGEIHKIRHQKLIEHSKTLECHPVIIPKGQHIAYLLIHHFHNNVRHQGRHITEGAIRTGGYWIIGGKRLI